MPKRDREFKPPSLAQHFEAPDGFVGSFGWICGYSADASFLDDAAERFMRRTNPQRAYEGRVAIALMLDPTNPQIEPNTVPGVLHLPIKTLPPFRLLHAKVALLGFRHQSDPRQWRLRLIVSTGNWTRETLEDNLDLAWRLDLSSQDLKEGGTSVKQRCADLRAAWQTLGWLQSHFDVRALDAKHPNRDFVVSESSRVEAWIASAIAVGKNITPRVFDNRQASFLSQLSNLVRTHGSPTSRNYLCMGSGFFESSADANAVPSVLAEIVTNLTGAGLLTKQAEIDVFVNPRSCQAVSTCVTAMTGKGWKVRDAGIPEYFKSTRSLHAKFIFSAINHSNSYFCNQPWVYLGSGNLTGPGFAARMSSKGGNLEAGVVFSPESLRWHSANGVSQEHVVTNVLPLQWKTDFSETPRELAAGADMPELTMQFQAAPVAFFFWEVTDDDGGWLQTPERQQDVFDVLDDAGHVCPCDSVKGILWTGQRPRQVLVRWHVAQQEVRAWVPVVDELGRFAATTLPQIDLDEAWSQLANFPMPPEDEELAPDGDDRTGIGADAHDVASSVAASYPVRQMMQLIEDIAAKQTSVVQADWETWCTRLEQCLIQASGSSVLGKFVALGLNPLSPLWHTPFRPAFAVNSDTPEGRRYESALRHVETTWNVMGLQSIGGNP